MTRTRAVSTRSPSVSGAYLPDEELRVALTPTLGGRKVHRAWRYTVGPLTGVVVFNCTVAREMEPPIVDPDATVTCKICKRRGG